jgi:hypothetical protein
MAAHTGLIHCRPGDRCPFRSTYSARRGKAGAGMGLRDRADSSRAIPRVPAPSRTLTPTLGLLYAFLTACSLNLRSKARKAGGLRDTRACVMPGNSSINPLTPRGRTCGLCGFRLPGHMRQQTIFRINNCDDLHKMSRLFFSREFPHTHVNHRLPPCRRSLLLPLALNRFDRVPPSPPRTETWSGSTQKH